jgi:hypothetical protein
MGETVGQLKNAHENSTRTDDSETFHEKYRARMLNVDSREVL